MYIIIAGCGRLGAELAKLLSSEGHDVVVIDKNAEAFRRLGPNFDGLTAVGSTFDLELLKSSGIEKADVFCSLTNCDNTNLMAAQIAKKMFAVPKALTRVNDPQRAQVFSRMGVDIISGTTLLAALLKDKVLAKK